MARKVNPEADRAAAQPSGGGSRRIVLAIVVLGLAGGGYYVWRHYRETGEIVGMDAEESKQLAERAKEFKEKAAETAREGATKARELLVEGREVLARRKTGLEAWFKERDIHLPTRKDLAATAKKYVKKFRDDDESGEAPEPDEKHAARPGDEKRPEADPLVLGKREFKKGFEHWQGARPGSPEEQEELGTARKRFTEAREHFEKAKELYPDDAASSGQRGRPDRAKIDELIADCNRFIYDCMKRTILDRD